MIDGTPVREKARHEYENVMRHIDSLKGDRERFFSQDQPAFSKWLNANFGAVLTELRELQKEVYEAEVLVSEVQDEFWWGNYRSISSAYEKVLHRRAHPEEEEEEHQPEINEAQELEEELNKLLDDMFGPEGAEEHERRKAKLEASPLAEEPTPAQTKLKDLYRALVRRLHPDHVQDLASQEIEWWHQTQKAYQAGDIEQLELILTLTEIRRNGTHGATVSFLKKLTAQFKGTLLSLKKELQKFQGDPAWDFKNKDRRMLMTRMRASFERDKRRMTNSLRVYKMQIEEWEAMRKKPRAPARTRRGKMDEKELF